MARDTRAAFLRALDEVSPKMAQAFEQAMDDVRSVARMRALDAAIQSALLGGNIDQGVEEILRVLGVGREFFAPLDEALTQAFIAGAQYQISTIPQRVAPYLNVRFDMRRPEAEAWTRENGARLIQNLQNDVRRSVREVLIDAAGNATPFQEVRKKLVGVRQGGENRSGGVIGLHPNQKDAVERAKQELLRGDWSAYKRRELRDRTYENERGGIITKAQKEDRPLSEAEADRVTRRYADRLLAHRGRTITRTETNRAMNAGRMQQMQQMIDDGKVMPSAVSKVWRATIGKFTRDHHLALHGVEVPWDQHFISPKTGEAMDCPHDEDAPGVDTINCRCVLFIRVDWKAVLDEMDRLEMAA